MNKRPIDGQHRRPGKGNPDYQQAKVTADIERAEYLLPAVLSMNTAACSMSGNDPALTLLAVTRHLVRFMVNQGMPAERVLPLLAAGAAEGQELKDQGVDLHMEIYLSQAPIDPEDED